MMDLIELMVSIITLIVTVIIGWKQLYFGEEMNLFMKQQEERDEKFRRDSINAEAIAFIQKYNQKGNSSEIRLLPLCVIAYKYDSIYPYRRLMYRDFCSRTETVRKEILVRCNMYYDCSEDKVFHKKILDFVYDNWRTIWDAGGHKHFDYFYDNCKYFETALSKYGSVSRLVDNFGFENEVRSLLKPTNDDDIESRRKDLDKYFKRASSIDVAYLCCLVAKYIAIVYGEYDDINKSVNLVDDYDGDLYMEDLFLDALLYVHLCQIKADKKNT